MPVATVESRKIDEALELLSDERTLEWIRVNNPEKFRRLASLLGLVQSRPNLCESYPAVRVHDK